MDFPGPAATGGFCTYFTVLCVFIRGGHAQLFLESAIAIPQLEGRTSAIAIPQLLKECCSATATPQFRNCNFKSATLELPFRNFRHIFGNGVDLNYIFFYRQVFFAIQRILKRE
jgi:hypothetical protein